MKILFNKICGIKIGLLRKIILTQSFFILVMVISILYFFIYVQNNTLISSTTKWGLSLASNLAYNSEYGVLIKDKNILSPLLENILKEKEILNVVLTDSNGSIIKGFKQMGSANKNNPHADKIIDLSEKLKSLTDPDHSNIKGDILEIIVPVTTISYDHAADDSEWMMGVEGIDTGRSNKSVKKDTIGYVIMEISLSGTKHIIENIKLNAFYIISLISLIFGLIYSNLLKIFLIDPITSFVNGADVISKGNYDQYIDISTNDEIGLLAKMFNKMAANIKISHEKIINYANELEQKVGERTKELESRNKELSIAHEILITREERLRNTQSQLVLSEKMASLGVLIAGIAHELNTPIGAIANASSAINTRIKKFIDNIDILGTLNQEELTKLKIFISDILNNKIGKDRLGRKEFDSIAKVREVRNFLSGEGIRNHREIVSILTQLNIVDIDKIKTNKDLIMNEKILSVIEVIGTIEQAQQICNISSKKIMDIIKALKYYAYTDMGNLEKININESIENVFILMQNKFKYQFNIIKDYGIIPDILCTSEINQVWTNLLSNSCDAITALGENFKGEINVKTKFTNNETVEIIISDNGNGIKNEDISKIFDPFFTTKGIGKGTGLGLSIVSGIIKKHNGGIRVDSEPGKTTFTITLPMGGNNATAINVM